jgi:hypothetical protein
MTGFETKTIVSHYPHNQTFVFLCAGVDIAVATQKVVPSIIMSSMTLVTTPNPNDVLCGRGRAIRNHPGNQRFLELIMQYKDEYMTARKGGKLDIVKTVMEGIKERNGSFLQQVKGSTNNGNNSDDQDDAAILRGVWTDIGEYRAMTKTSQAFRDLRAAANNAAKASSQTTVASAIEKIKKRTKQQLEHYMSSGSTTFGSMKNKKQGTEDGVASSADSSSDSSSAGSSSSEEEDSDSSSSGSSEEEDSSEDNSSSEEEEESDDDDNSDEEDPVQHKRKKDKSTTKNNNKSSNKKKKARLDNPQCPVESGDEADMSNVARKPSPATSSPSLTTNRQKLASLQQRLSYTNMTGKQPKALVASRKVAATKIKASVVNNKGSLKAKPKSSAATAEVVTHCKGTAKAKSTTSLAITSKTKQAAKLGSTAVAHRTFSSSSLPFKNAMNQDDSSDTETEDSFEV